MWYHSLTCWWAVRPVPKMASQYETAICVPVLRCTDLWLQFNLSIVHGLRRHYFCVVCVFQTVHETHAALYSQIWTPQNGVHRKPSTSATPSWKLVRWSINRNQKWRAYRVWETWTVSANDSVCYYRKKNLHGLSPRANYTDWATATCRRSDCQLLRIEGATWSAWRIPTDVFSVF
jgi:hypothetical protein